MYKPLPEGLTIKASNVQGLGLFATKDFKADVVLGIAHIKNKNFPHGYIRTALGAFYNHSDTPNCKNLEGFWHHIPVKYLVTQGVYLPVRLIIIMYVLLYEVKATQGSISKLVLKNQESSESLVDHGL